jgi:hypothetical protein
MTTLIDDTTLTPNSQHPSSTDNASYQMHLDEDDNSIHYNTGEVGPSIFSIAHGATTPNDQLLRASSSREEGAEALSFLRTSTPTFPFHPLGMAPVITSDQPQELISKLTTSIKITTPSPQMTEEHPFNIANPSITSVKAFLTNLMATMTSLLCG